MLKMILYKFFIFNLITFLLPQVIIACSRGRHDNILRSDDLIILEMSDQIDQTSLKELLSEENEVKMKVRAKSNEEHEEIKITFSAVWDIKGFAKSGKITVDPSEITIGPSDEIEEELALTNLNIPGGNSEKRLVITANATNCTDEETGCNNRFTRIIKRNILIKNVIIGTSKPCSNIGFDRKYKGCTDAQGKEEICKNNTWRVDFTIPKNSIPSGLNKVELKDQDGNNEQIRFWHPNFDIGTTEMIKVSANATCCVKTMDFEAIGVSKGYNQVISVFSDGSSCGTKRFVSKFSFILTFFAFILINTNKS